MMRAITTRFTWPLAVLLLAGCTSKEIVAPLGPPPTRPFGPLSVTVEPLGLSGDVDLPPYGKGDATIQALKLGLLLGYGIGTAGGRPISGEALVFGTALGIVTAPILAVYAAVITPSEEDAKAAGLELAHAIEGTHWHQLLQDSVRHAMQANGLPESPGAAVGRDRLHLAIEPPLLALRGVIAIPTLTVRAQLASGDDCLLDRKWHWNGESDSFVDFGDDRAAAFRAQTQGGVAAIAHALAYDVAWSAPPRATPGTAEHLLPPWWRAAVAHQPFEYERMVGSWNTTEYQRNGEPSCSALLPKSTQPEAAACRLPACRAAGAWPVGEI